jgi:hypothetical protein
MKSIFKTLFLILCSVGFLACTDSKSTKGGNHQKDVDLHTQSKDNISKKEDLLLICDEFRSRFESKQYLCIISYSNECPMAKSYIKTIQNMVSRFGDTIQFCLLDPGVGSKSIGGLESLMFHDQWGLICKRFNIRVYPQAVVYDCLNREILYSGKIDDRAQKLGVVSRFAKKNYLLDVLNNVMLKEPIKTTSNEAIGCFIGPFDDENK